MVHFRPFSILFFVLLVMAGGAHAQRMSLAPDAFLNDINSVAGMAKVGGVFFAADPQKKQWGDYCTASQQLAQRGEFRQAIRTAAKALYLGETQFKNYGAPVIYASGDIASAYSYAGDHASASLWADRTLALIAKGYESWAHQDVVAIVAGSHRIKALALSHDGRHGEAIAQMQKSLDALPSFGRGPLRAELTVTLASLHTRSGQYDKAAEALARLSSETQPFLRVAILRALGDLALAQKKAADAAGHYANGLRQASESRDGHLTAMLRLGLARAARLAGNAAAASTELQQALATLENLRSWFSSGDMRTALYGNLQSVFDEAVDFFAQRGDAEQALAVSEASRARAMLDLQRKDAPGSPPVQVAVRPKPLPQIQAQLAAGQSLLVFHQLPASLLAWVVARDGVRMQVLPVSADTLQREVNLFRNAIAQEGRTTLAMAQSLHQRLVAPLKLPAGAELVIAPHRSLHLLPFQALHDGSRWLVEQHAISTVMSASLLDAPVKAPAASRLAALGNPDVGKAEWALPGAEAEVRALQGIYEQSSVFVQNDASKARLLAIAPGADVVHVAAHAVVDEVDPMYSTIKLANAVTLDPAGVPALSPDMEAREFATLDLRQAGLVTLSACSSGLGKVAEGDEFMGFKRALMAAGARSVLVSLWPVEDESTRSLMTEFHQRWKAAPKSRAMQAAQLKLLADPRYAHPFYWAAFTLVGDPG